MGQDCMQEMVALIRERRAQYRLPDGFRDQVETFALQLLGLLFPEFSPHPSTNEAEIEHELCAMVDRMCALLNAVHDDAAHTSRVKAGFHAQLPGVMRALDLDANAILAGDPAARSLAEVVLSYPGFFAIALYRVAHLLHTLGAPLLPRQLTEFGHRETGIDIHPGAEIGHSFFIDHGTGVVVGETVEIGNNVKLYQGVTLGALAVQKNLAARKRHPTLQDNVVIYANATILGGQTVIGHDTVVGGNAWITESVPPFSIVGRNTEVRRRQNGDDFGLDYHI